jgi:uncharacterized membrane protein YgdD (TMEM256/DUF423 family)
VAAGAFGAHALQGTVTPDRLEIWGTAASYLLIHGVAVCALGIVLKSLALLCLLLGATVFSGSLFALVLADIPMLGAVAPVGGATMIVGWLWVAFAIARGSIRL